MSIVRIAAPLSGWCMPLAEVPDPVFAEKLAGDGVAIDPVEGILLAPCDGEIVAMQNAKHAVTVRTPGGIDVMMHIGIDTVGLAGEGFDWLVKAGAHVAAGTPLVRFDLDLLARRAKSLATPIILAAGGTITSRASHRRIAAGELLFEVKTEGDAPGKSSAQAADEITARFIVPFDHGLHVRPAALIAAALRPFAAVVTLVAHGRSANARSTVAMMALGVRAGEPIEARAHGADARAALDALGTLLDLEAKVTPPAAKPHAAVLKGRIEAVIASRGVAVGVAVPWSQAEVEVLERGGAEPSETAALRNAIAFVKHHLGERAAAASGSARELLAAHAELVDDPELAEGAAEWLKRGYGAAFAWRQAARAMAAALAALEDPRMRERAADLRDLEGQVIRVLRGELPSAGRELPRDAIVVADDLLPSQLLALDATRLAGLALARGGATSHVAIIAASQAIPTLVAAGAAVLDIAEGTPIILDAEHGWIDVDPPAAELANAARAAVQRAQERAADLAAAAHPATTLDGVRIVVNANVGSIEEAHAAVRNGADGCGLLRTEFLFLERREAPGEEEQLSQYQRIVAALDGRSAAIRTLDAGGDKPIAYMPMPREDNPALGLRGVRGSLRHPDLLRTQVSAMLRVTPAGACRILLPMVNDLEDLRAVRAIVEERARALQVKPAALGVMIETPAAAVLAAQLAAEADFLSIGTNDLSQYTLAIDRAHAELAERLDALHPAVLRMIETVANAARAAGKSVSVCGAMGSDVDALPVLIGLGVHEVSATPAMVPRLKRTARLLDAAECRELARRALGEASAAPVRELAQGARARARAAAQPIGG